MYSGTMTTMLEQYFSRFYHKERWGDRTKTAIYLFCLSFTSFFCNCSRSFHALSFFCFIFSSFFIDLRIGQAFRHLHSTHKMIYISKRAPWDTSISLLVRTQTTSVETFVTLLCKPPDEFRAMIPWNFSYTIITAFKRLAREQANQVSLLNGKRQ